MIAAAPPPGAADPMTWAYVGAAVLGICVLAAVVVACVLIVELFTRAANRRRPDIVTSHTPATAAEPRGHAHVLGRDCDGSQEREGT